MALICFEDTLACLRLRSLGGDRWEAVHIPADYRRVFGGQLLAQIVMAASQSAPGKTVRSLHANFPREGDLSEDLVYRAERLQDGRSFCGRWIVGEQAGQIIVAASVSLHAHEPGLSHQLEAPEVGTPEQAEARDLSMIPWETRVVGGTDLAARDAGPASYRFWMRTPALPDDAAVHQALFAHATDLTLIGTSLRPHAGLGEADSPERIRTAVTTHTIWFHRPLRLDDWILIDQHSPSAAFARGFGLGHAFSRRGELVASFAQESLIRPMSEVTNG
jgi:acyl-CoA thioesterase-2